MEGSRRTSLAPIQWAAIAGALLVLLWSVPGIIVNPDFGIGDDARAERVLGADMNGWHALAGFLVAVPALVLVWWPRLLPVYLPLAAGGLLATGIWALFSTEVAGGLFPFPNNEADALLHFVTASVWLGGVLAWRAGDRGRSAAVGG